MWKVYSKKADFTLLGSKFNIDPLVIRVLVNRDIKDEDKIRLFFDGKLEDLHSANLLPDIEKAVNIISKAIKDNKKIRVVGDYDADGICSTFILVDALKKLGANVSYVIPDRIKDGYGINMNIIDDCIKDKIDLIITCDNGIAAEKEIKHAKENNIQFVVTDHHEVSEFPKDADSVVCPKREDSKYPFMGICGAVVALKVVTLLGIPFIDYLEFACLATITDIMPLLDENRIIVKEGLEFIKNNKINIGFEKLIQVAQIKKEEMNSYKLGFIIGPLINASGRISTADIALKLFLSKDENEAEKYAEQLKTLNDERKNITEENANLCINLCEEKYNDDKVLVLYLPKLHESVAGIVAGRVVEKFNKPAMVITNTQEDGIAKGSARSIEKYNMFEELSKVKDIFTKFGGHKGAAGFSLPINKIDELRKRLNENTTLEDSDLEKVIWLDSELPFSYISEKLINDLSLLEPYGSIQTFFPAPLFGARNINISNIKVFGQNRNVIKMQLYDGKVYQTGIMFGNGDEFVEQIKNDKTTINIAFIPEINEFNGKKSIELRIKEWT